MPNYYLGENTNTVESVRPDGTKIVDLESQGVDTATAADVTASAVTGAPMAGSRMLKPVHVVH
jgi:hypothetical protein